MYIFDISLEYNVIDYEIKISRIINMTLTFESINKTVTKFPMILRSYYETKKKEKM